MAQFIAVSCNLVHPFYC